MSKRDSLDQASKVPSDDLRGATSPETTSMSNTPRGLPLTRSHVEQIFPKLTPAQIRRIAAHGHMRAMQRGEVLYRAGRQRRTVLCCGLRRARDCAPLGRR